MANVTGAELAAPEPLVTVTGTEAGLVRSAAGTVAVRDVAETYVVVKGVPFHCTTEEVRKPEPVTVRRVAGAPAFRPAGVSDVTVTGDGATIGSCTTFDVPPAAGSLTTVTGTLAAAATWAAVTCAVSCVAESKVVGMALPFHCTVADERKFVPVTTS
jgi:hypothetical protein